MAARGRPEMAVLGALAQLVARFHGMEEVRGSNPLCSTLTKISQTDRKV